MPETFSTENDYGSGQVQSWASILEDNTREQAEAISRHPLVETHIALMPDAHFGFGPPVGSAIHTTGGVMPYAVGVDIGCGMIAVETDLVRLDFAGREGRVMAGIRTGIPSGVGTQRDEVHPRWDKFYLDHGSPEGLFDEMHELKVRKQPAREQWDALIKRAAIQFGTLGAGNHFVEVSTDDDGRVWLFLHSGSRGIGNIIAQAYVQRAKQLCEQYELPLEDREFAYFPSGWEIYSAYLADMEWAQYYAYAQRETMMVELELAVQHVLGDFQTHRRINCHHNYAERTETGLLTRKGAIDASLGKLGVVPGSMGTSSYIVEGLGNEDAHYTSAHGAGRVMSRGQARKTLDLDEFRAQMVDKTWLDRDAEDLLDEAPGAYKDIDQVMADSEALIRPVAQLTSFINYKGV